MALYMFKRLLAAAVTLFAILTLAFWVVRLMPGSPYDDPNLDPAAVELLNRRAGLDRPVAVQYALFLKGVVLTGDWGVSTRVEPGVPVFRVLAGRIPVSLGLNALALLAALPLGLLCGAAAALARGRRLDRAIGAGVVLGVSIPSFVVASLLQYGLAFRLGWLPILYEPSGSLGARLASMALPAAALALSPIAVLARYLRGELAETLGADFMLLARAKGLSARAALLRHGLRNAAVPMINVLAPMLAGLLGGSMVVERLFSIPGVGGVMIRSVQAGDHFLTAAALIFYAAVAAAAGFVIDLLYGLIDPRIRVGGRPDG